MACKCYVKAQSKDSYFEHSNHWAELLTIYGVVALWRSYLCLRTIARLKKLPSAPVVFDGIIDAPTFEKLKISTKSESYDKLLEELVDFGIKVFHIISGYYPYVWQLTVQFSQSLFYRAVWFSVIERILYQCSFIPVQFVHALYHRRDPFLAILNGIYETLYSAGVSAIWAFVMVYTFEAIQPSGLVSLMILYDIFGLVLVAVLLKFLENYILRPLPRNEVGSTIDLMTTRVGYPISKVYVDEMTPDPEVLYYTALGFNMVTITPRVMSILDPDQISALVAHELGKWYYFQEIYNQLFHFCALLLKCYTIVSSYGSPRVLEIFRVDSSAHPIIAYYLAYHFLWKPSLDVGRGFYNVFKSLGFIIRDNYSCRVWKPNSLKEALIKLSRWNMMYFPLFDGWHSAWYYGSPTSVHRITRILRTEHQL